MIFNKYIRYSLCTAMALCATGAMAQELEGNVVVKGVYQPEIIPAERVDTYPTQMQFPATSNPLKYDMSMVAAPLTPSVPAEAAPLWDTDRNWCARRGSVNFGLGRWLDSYLNAKAVAICRNNERLAVGLSHNSTSLWTPQLTTLRTTSPTPDYRRFRYDERVGAQYSRTFDGLGALEANVGYHFGHFNYYGAVPEASYPLQFESSYLSAPEGITISESGEKIYKAPAQTVNDATWRATWWSNGYMESNPESMRWYAGIDGRWFGYNRLYTPYFESYRHMRGDKETRIGAHGGIWQGTALAPTSYGIDIDGQMLMYNKNRFLTTAPVDRNYGMIAATPAWQSHYRDITAHLGVRIDATINAMGIEPGLRYAPIHFAPDVRFDWRGTYTKVYISATGGSRLQTLADAYDALYYATPWLNSTTPVYTPIDARIGMSGAWQGVTLSAEFAYAKRKHIRVDGYYTSWLSDVHKLCSDHGIYRPNFISDIEAIDLEGIKVSGKVRYDMSDLLRMSIEGSYTPQRGNWGWMESMSEMDRARIHMNVTAESNPIKGLRLRASWAWRGQRRPTLNSIEEVQYNTGTLEDPVYKTVNITKSCLWKLPNYSMVNFACDYEILRNLDVTLRLDNLLNRNNMILPDVKDSGISFTIGAAYRF